MFLCIRSPNQRFIRSFVSRQHFPAQRKGGGISKGGNLGSPLWLRAVRHALQRLSAQEKQTRHTDSYHKWSAATTTIIHYSLQYSLFISSVPPLTPCRRHAPQRLSFQKNKPDTNGLPQPHRIIFRRATKVCLRTTERM